MPCKDEPASIFSEFFRGRDLVDRFKTDGARSVDVIVPVIHTNELWRANLLSIYREIPVNRLLLGDGGCIDESLEVAREFPRVEVLDHRSFTSLGFSIRRLIEAVETEWFVYLHSDVYLPPGWFDAMCAHKGEFDWFECNQQITLMAQYLFELTQVKRAYSGSQMGRKAAFATVTPLIQDDYLYRNEDIIIAHLISKAGLRYGKTAGTFHYHQVMHKPSRWHRRVQGVKVELEIAADEEIRSHRTYAYGIIKYMKPADTTPDIVDSVRFAVSRLVELGDTTIDDVRKWVRQTNGEWLPALTGPLPSRRRERIADQIVTLADFYRARGLWWTVHYTFSRLGRKLAMRLQGLWLTIRGGLRRLMLIWRENGAAAAWQSLLRGARGR